MASPQADSTSFRFRVGQALLPVRHATSLVSSVLGGISLVSIVRRAFDLDPSAFVVGVLKFYEATVRAPLAWALEQVGVAVSQQAADAVALYLLFGVASVRSLFAVYNAAAGVYVVKGLWGRLTGWFLRIAPAKASRWLYQFLAILLWPVVAAEYTFRYKHVWRRYMDDNHRPDFAAQIGTVTTGIEAPAGLHLYNARVAYDVSSDTWYRREGDFRYILLGNIALVTLCAAMLLALGSLGPS